MDQQEDRDSNGQYKEGHKIPGSGRPTAYKDEYAGQAEKLVRLGATDYELADFFGVNVSTIHRWKHAYDAFCSAVRGVAKDIADSRVERSLYTRATGYEYESEKVFQFQGEIVRTTVKTHVQPDPSAAMNWLKNRKPEEWREKQLVEHSGKVEKEHTIDEETKDFIEDLLGVEPTTH